MAENPPLALRDVPWAPGRVKAVERDQPPLVVGAGAHLLSGADENARAAGVDVGKEAQLGGVVDEGDLLLAVTPPAISRARRSS